MTDPELFAYVHTSHFQPNRTKAQPSGLQCHRFRSDPLRGKALHLADLQQQQRKLQTEIRQRQTARRLFALWHTIHIPLGLTLFLIAFVHIGAAIYYPLMLR